MDWTVFWGIMLLLFCLILVPALLLISVFTIRSRFERDDPGWEGAGHTPGRPASAGPLAFGPQRRPLFL